MGVIIVPFNYNEESNFSVVPICIGDIDSAGNPIHREWVEHGVVPVADPLRKIASRVLSDVWRVSEITERAVHSLSRKHHGDLGDEPSLRILKRAYRFQGSARRVSMVSSSGRRLIRNRCPSARMPDSKSVGTGSSPMSIDSSTLRPPPGG